MNNAANNLQKVGAAIDAMKVAVASARERLGEGLQLTRTQLEILMMLSTKPHTTSELAGQLFITGSAVTQTVDTLVRRDLVDRQTDDTDRRITQLHLSPAGRTITDHLLSLRRARLQSLVDQLTEAEIEAFISATEKITTQLKEGN